MALYRKYRPQLLSELDNEEIRTRLTRILGSPYSFHALLFAGPKGTGKTSAARIVAKVLNCEKRILRQSSGQAENKEQKIEPCNSCDSCMAIREGRHLDVFEIDAASNRGIDEIRDLREKIKLAPVSGRAKVYIIDEVHMLTNEAFNALLKTLEEPPPHAVFLLATTEPEKLPGTIISRCIRFNFNKAMLSEVLHSLNRVAEGEKVKVSRPVLEKIAKVAEGSFRDATKILEQAISENALSEEKIITLLGSETGVVKEFLLMLSEKKEKELLNLILQMLKRGADFRIFVTEILLLLHKILLSQHGIIEEKIDENDQLLKINQTTLLIKLFSKAYLDMKYASYVYLPLEVLVVEWCESSY